MDKTFEDAIAETLEDLVSDGNEAEAIETDAESTPADEVDNEVDEDTADSSLDELDDEDDVDSEGLELANEEATAPSTNQKDAQAFARMRTELKEANDIIKFFDERAKQMGLGDVQGLMEKTRETELAKKAQAEGIPVEVLKRLDELENKVKQQDFEKEQLEQAKKEQAINHTFEKFVQNNSLNQESVNKLAKNLVDDGFSLEFLMSMPSTAVNKILSSYLPQETAKQAAIAKKEQIKKEMPVQDNASSTNNNNDEIDKIAKLWAGQY